MQNVLQTGKRALSVAIAAATILFSVGAGLLQPSVAAAASAGDLIKGTSLSTVYYYGYDGMRYTFPNEKTYMTWYENFDDVITISDSELADLSLAGNVVYRPGSYWVKVQSDDKVYAVSTDGSIHWIESEDVAVDLGGSDWNTRVQDVPDVFFTDYAVGSSLMAATAYDGMLYMDGGNYYIAWDGEMRMVSSAGRSANGLQSGFFLSGSGIDDSSLTAGDDITSSMSDLMDPAQTVEEENPTTGDVSVSLASSTPASATIPDAASGVEVATFAFTAGEEATIDVMNVALMGLAATSDFTSSGVYLYEGEERLTDGKSFNSSTRKAVFGSLNLDFSADETRYFSIVVDLANTNVTTDFSVGFEGEDDIESSGDVSGSFPISGNTMSIVNSSVGSVTITDTGSLSNPVLGENDAIISEFKLAVGSTEDVNFERITLKVNDAADHDDFQLWQGDDWLAEGEYIGEKLVMFNLDTAFAIEKGADRTFTVTADIGGDAADEIEVYLDNSADLYVVGDDFGYGVTVTRTGFDGGVCTGSGSDECSSTTIQGGELTIAFDGPAAVDVSSTAENFSLFEGALTAERNMTITAMPFSLAISEADAAGDSTLEDDPISDIRVVNADTGDLLAGPLDLASTGAASASETISFTDDYEVAGGETLNFKVTADVESTADNNDTFTLTMDLTTGLTAEDDTGDAITDIVPGADLAGNAQRIVTSGLTVSLASTPNGTKTYVRGTSDVEVVAFNFAAASGGDIEVTDFNPTVKVDEDGAGTYATGIEGTTSSVARITSCSLYDGTTLVDGPESVASTTTGKLLFADFSYWVTAGQTATLSLYCNLANVAPGTADLFAFTVIAATDVTALDADGDSATVTGTNINFASSTPTAIISIANAGTMTITAASDLPTADFLLTGSSSNTVSKFRFDSANEAFTVDRLTVTEEQAETDTGTVDSTAYANNVSLVTLSYPCVVNTSTCLTGTNTVSGALTGNEVTFNSLVFYVAKDNHAEVTVMVSVPSTDRSGGSGTSNERIRMGLSRDTTNDDQIRAVGTGSGQTLDDDDIAVATATTAMNKFVIRETKPTIALNTSSPTGGKVPGDQEVLRFNVAASSGEDVVLKNMIFTFSASDNASSGWNDCDGDASGIVVADFDLYDTADLATALDIAADWSFLEGDATVCDAASSGDNLTFVKLSLTTQEVVPAGSTYTYALYFDSTGASSVNDDSLQLGIAGDPIVSTLVALGTARTVSGAHTISTTTLTGSAALDTTADSAVAVGDILAAAGAERMLVVAYTGGASAATVLRGYLGTTQVALSGGEAITRVPGALLWQDDGTTGVTTPLQEYYGAHLVDNLPVTGYGISF
ncbi:MAG: hypothetical protein AAB839_02230 [Patescibacteria group bacterium]